MNYIGKIILEEHLIIYCVCSLSKLLPLNGLMNSRKLQNIMTKILNEAYINSKLYISSRDLNPRMNQRHNGLSTTCFRKTEWMPIKDIPETASLDNKNKFSAIHVIYTSWCA